MASFAPTVSDDIGIVWFRNSDLRVRDNEMLQLAHSKHTHVVHIYIFDDRIFRSTVDFSRSLPSTHWPKTGPFKTKFLLEAVSDLRQSLQTITNHSSSNVEPVLQDLIVRCGIPEEVIPSLSSFLGARHVYCHEGEASEELTVQASLKQALKNQATPSVLHSIWGGTMYHMEDMPTNFFQRFPSSATQFRNIVESKNHPGIRPPQPAPGETKGYALRPLPPVLHATDMGIIPTLSVFLPEAAATLPIPNEESLHFVGGETAGLARIQEYFFDHDCLKSYFSSRNGMLGKDYSSKFSPWLAAGCISAREVAAAVKRYETERVQSKETYWMLFELIFRDYFRFYGKVHGSKVFKLWGPKGKARSNRSEPWVIDLALFDKWRNGQTGNPMIDANMRELLATGFMSNRGRQIVASYLTRDMNLDWRLGAMHFESLLIDHDVCLNWGNWTYSAGVGSDPREDRYFSIPKQTSNYDPDHRYIKYWCEEARLMMPDQLNRHLKSGTMLLNKTPLNGSNNNKKQGQQKSKPNGQAKSNDSKSTQEVKGNGSTKSTNKSYKKYTKIKV